MADRAAVVTTAILQIVTNALRQRMRDEPGVALRAVRAEVEAVIRGEIADVAREARGEREPPDA